MTNTEQISTLYRDITIVYNERDNKWVFELRGRERSAESLEKAKAAIDKPAPSETEEKPFERVKCYRSNYESDYETVDVTSMAEYKYGSQRVWILSSSKNRLKVSIRELFPCTPTNSGLVSEINRLTIEMKHLKQKRERIECKLKRLKV